jgi:hypothetical protein
MPIRRVSEPDGYTETPNEAVSEVESAPWSPAQLLALGIGLFFALLGGVALARTGFNLNDVHDPHRVVGWGDWHHTPLLGAIELGFGVLMLLAAAVPGAGRAIMGFLSAVAVGFGIFIVADGMPARLHAWLGVHHANGWLYVVTGAIGLVGAMFSPVVWRRSRTVTQGQRRGFGRREAVYER